MERPLFYIFCLVATLAIVEAVPWYRRPTVSKIQSSDNNADDFGVESFAVNADGTKARSDGGLKRGNQNTNENQNEAEGTDDRGDNNGYKVGGGSQAGRRAQGGREINSGRGNLGGGYQENQGGQKGQNNEDDSYLGITPQNEYDNKNHYDGEGVVKNSGNGYQGRVSPTGHPGNGKNKNNDRSGESSDDGEDSDEYHYSVPKKSKHGCRGCRLTNIGNGRSNRNNVYVHEYY